MDASTSNELIKPVSKINLTHLPDDMIRTFCKYLTLEDILRFECTSVRFADSKKYIISITHVYLHDKYQHLIKLLKKCSSLQYLNIKYPNSKPLN